MVLPGSGDPIENVTVRLLATGLPRRSGMTACSVGSDCFWRAEPAVRTVKRSCCAMACFPSPHGMFCTTRSLGVSLRTRIVRRPAGGSSMSSTGIGRLVGLPSVEMIQAFMPLGTWMRRKLLACMFDRRQRCISPGRMSTTGCSWPLT